MTFKMSKRNTVRVISFSCAAVLLIAGAAVSGFQLVSRYRATIEHTYQQALSEFSDYFTNLQSALTKGVYANYPDTAVWARGQARGRLPGGKGRAFAPSSF